MSATESVRACSCRPAVRIPRTPRHSLSNHWPRERRVAEKVQTLPQFPRWKTKGASPESQLQNIVELVNIVSTKRGSKRGSDC